MSGSEGAVFIPNVGFRPSEGALQLREAVSVTERGRTLSVDRLLATASGTELRFAYTGIEIPWRDAIQTVTARLEDEAGTSYRLGRWWSSGTGIDGGIRRDVAFEPLSPGRRRVQLIVGEGDIAVSVWLDLAPVDERAARRHALDASDAHHGVTVRVRGIAFDRERTAVDLEATGSEGIRFVRGIGAMFGGRRGPTKLRLRDDKGREVIEFDPSVPPKHDPTGKTDLAEFPAVPEDAAAFELFAEHVLVEELAGEVDIPLPVTETRSLMFGPYPIRVHASSVADPPPERSRSPFDPRALLPGVRIDVEFGEWREDRRLLYPGRVLIDGEDCGFRWLPVTPDEGGPPNAKQVTYLEVPVAEPASARAVTFRYPTVHHRGPWTIRFARPA